MGAKTWMLVYSQGNVGETLRELPELERDKTRELVKQLFPKYSLEPIDDGDLSDTAPPDNAIYAGYYSGVFIVAASEFGIDYPSKISLSFLNQKIGNTIQLHAMHSVVDWFAFAIWSNGKLQRSLSLSPDSGILENIGETLSFEKPFWNGEHPAIDPEDQDDDDDEYPFPFHPLELGETTLNNLFGYQLEGFIGSSLFQPDDIPLLGFKRIKQWWKIW